MKGNYFGQPEPDHDDHLLQRAIEDQKVPPGCLLGGVLLHDLLSVGMNPCDVCTGPRDRCGGSPPDVRRMHELRDRAGKASAAEATNDEPGALKGLRRQWCQQILKETRERGLKR